MPAISFLKQKRIHINLYFVFNEYKLNSFRTFVTDILYTKVYKISNICIYY